MNKITSKIYTLINPRKLVLSEEIIDPKTIEKDEIIAQTIYSAISPGTELAAYCGIEPLRKNIITYPRLLGYCNVAKIIHLGEESEKWHVGDYILTFQSHRTHFRFRLSDFMIKLNPSFLKESTVSYLYHLGFHSVHTAELKIGHNAAIIGMGVLGYTSATISKLAGGTTFIFTNQLEHIKLIQEKKMTYFPKNKESLKHINELTENI
ncbi:MAG: zinc-binding dehydrogenase, partial [Marinilabiliales bacterium]